MSKEALARKYTKSQNHRYAILSNGNLHDLWGLHHGNPHAITAFGMSDFKAKPWVWRTRIPEYVKDYVPLNQFM